MRSTILFAASGIHSKRLCIRQINTTRITESESRKEREEGRRREREGGDGGTGRLKSHVFFTNNFLFHVDNTYIFPQWSSNHTSRGILNPN